MNKFQKDDALKFLKNSFPESPIPNYPGDNLLFNDTIYDFRIFKNRFWSDVTVDDIERSWGFCSGKYEIADDYYLYYMTGVIFATYDKKDYFYISLESLLPNTKNYRVNERWRKLINNLSSENISTLIAFFKKCEDSFEHAKTMETLILIDLLAEAGNSRSTY